MSGSISHATQIPHLATLPCFTIQYDDDGSSVDSTWRGHLQPLLVWWLPLSRSSEEDDMTTSPNVIILTFFVVLLLFVGCY